MYGTGAVASVACAELTGIVSTTTRAASPEPRTANRWRTTSPEPIAPTAQCITHPTGRNAKQPANCTCRGQTACEARQLTEIWAAHNRSTTAWRHARDATKARAARRDLCRRPRMPAPGAASPAQRGSSWRPVSPTRTETASRRDRFHTRDAADHTIGMATYDSPAAPRPDERLARTRSPASGQPPSWEAATLHASRGADAPVRRGSAPCRFPRTVSALPG